MRRLFSSLLLATAITIIQSCASVELQEGQQSSQEISNIDRMHLAYRAYANSSNSPARNTKSCTVEQVGSAHNTEIALEEKSRHQYRMSSHSQNSRFLVTVFRNGDIGLSLTNDAYPGSTVYFLINAKRYSGTENQIIRADFAALESLKSDALVQISFTQWPYGHEVNVEDILPGFTEAYEECVAFMRS